MISINPIIPTMMGIVFFALIAIPLIGSILSNENFKKAEVDCYGTITEVTTATSGYGFKFYIQTDKCGAYYMYEGMPAIGNLVACKNDFNRCKLVKST